jgi:lectin-like protein/putative metal-binding protein
VSRSWCLCWIAAAACARGDADTPDARADGPPCAEQTYYRDADGDGHGDPLTSVQACEAPAGTVANKDDCDDTDAQRHPGLAEICDGLDNDCDPATIEACPTGCTALRRPPPDSALHAYLVCTTSASWLNASALCASAMYKLVEIDDTSENAYVRSIGDAAFGTNVDFHIGGNDRGTEGVWVWESGVQFWQGGSGGATVGGHYANWNSGEPNDNNGEDCSEMRTGGLWNDTDCSSDSQPFICRR